MSAVAVVTDTTQYLPRDVIERHGLHLVSLYVNWDGRIDRESDLADYDEYYEFLRSGGDLPSTSQPSVGDFLAVYEPLVERGDEILSIHLSGGISGTVRAAEQARDLLIERGMAAERMVVIDSLTGCAGHGFMSISATNAVAAGADLAGAVAAARAMRENLKIIVMVDTLEYLRRGGRIGSAQAWIGSTLKIKPILTFEEEVTPVERVRTRKRAVARLVDFARQRHGEGADGWVVQHIRDPESAAEMVEACKPIFGREPEFVSELGAVLGAHAGPGMIGVGSVPASAFE
jgi:DegV family protein with EDD domain